MRYIRDIIKEKNMSLQDVADASELDVAEGKSSQPLLLKEPVVPGDTTKSIDAEVPELPIVSAKTSEDTFFDAPEETQPDIAPPTARLVMTTEEEDQASESETLTDADPFEKLRHSAGATQQSAVSVSPLRNRPVSKPVIQHAAPEPSPERKPRETESGTEKMMPIADALAPENLQMPSPALGRGSKVSGRVKTRLLGFSADALDIEDPFEKADQPNNDFPVGWLVVVSDKGRGKAFALRDGVSKVGRGTDQTVCLDFGDNSISRDNHVSIAFDSEQKKFFVGHSGKSNLVRLNNAPLLSTEQLRSKDMIRLGETTLRFVALCDEDFNWDASDQQMAQRA